MATVNFEGKTYDIIGDTTLAHNSQYGDHYKADALDQDGEDVTIVWEINHPEFEDLEDESDACDWEHPLAVIPS